MEESRSQRPKGDLSFQLLGTICLPAMGESSKSRMIWESAENHLGNPKGHPKVAENPRKLSAAQLEKRQPKGLKVCSIWLARRASSLPRRRNHKKECLLLIRVSTFHNFEHQPTCLCTTLAFLNWGQFGSIETIICTLQILSFEASQYSLLQVFWDPDFGWISLATHHHLQVCALLVVGFVDEAWHVSWLVRFPRRTFIIELSFKPAHTMHCGNSWNTCLRPIRLGFLREQLFDWELHGKIAILHLEKYLSFNAETWNIGWFIHDFIPFHPFQHHFDSSQKRSAID